MDRKRLAGQRTNASPPCGGKEKKRNTFEVRLILFCLQRKTVSDLSASIKDGRYRDQKFRLSRAGLSGVVYLIEGPLLKPKQFNEKAAWSLLPVETLEAAITSTSYGSSAFMVERSPDAAHTARWLARYTSQLQEQVIYLF